MCSRYGEQEAINYVMDKNSWLTPNTNNIEWEILYPLSQG